MNKLDKILKIIFLTLFFIIILEIGYYIFFNSLRKIRPARNNQPNISLKSDTTNLYSMSLPKNISESDLAINKNTLQEFYRYTKDTLVSSITTNRFIGEVVKLNKTAGKTPQGFEYKLELIIQGDKTKKGFLYNDYDLKIIKITAIVNGKEQNITLDNLRKGDKIIITETIDLTKSCDRDQCIKEIKITKI